MTSQSNSRPKDLEPLTDRDPRQLGMFRLVGRLGSGGMGVAYFAEVDGVHGVEPAVVKVVHANLAADRSFSARLSRELDVMRKVSGRFTAQLLDSDVNHDPPWFAMEYIPGLTLARLIEEFGPLATEQLIPFANQLLEIIANIHAQGVVHRDIKPANIMMSPTGPRLIDFGIADLSEGTQLTKTGSVLGSMGWMAPEQVRNDPATPATDIHAWALTVLFASTGQAPFGAANSTAAMYKVLEETPRIPQSIPPPLAQALKQALVKQPNYRPVVGQLQTTINVRGAFVPPRTGTQTPTDPQPPTPSALRQRPNFKPLLIITVIGLLIGGLLVGKILSNTTTGISNTSTVGAGTNNIAATPRDQVVAVPRVVGKFGANPVIAKPKGSPPTKLIIKDLVVGKGKPVSDITRNYLWNYEGVSWSTGKVFDSSFERGAPVPFALNQVITGWTEGMQGIKPGGRRLLIIPAEKGYGAVGSPPAIGPNETLVFVVDLVGVAD